MSKQDGHKHIRLKVNDKLWIVSNRKKKSQECTVTKVGNKYFEIESESINMLGDKILISKINNSDIFDTYKIYSSEREYLKENKIKQIISILKENECSLEQVEKMYDILLSEGE